MLVELIPTRRSVTYAARCDGGTVRRYERGRPYRVEETLGHELLATKRFQLSTAPIVDKELKRKRERAAALLDKLGSMGPEFLDKLEAVFASTMAASVGDTITSKDTAPQIPSADTPPADDEIGFSEVSGAELKKMQAEEAAAMEGSLDPLPSTRKKRTRKSRAKK